MTAPAPCPFCGSLNIDDEQGETYRWRRAYCVDCGVRGSEIRCQVTGSGANTRALAEARAAAFEEWNRRASPAPQALPVVLPPLPVKFEWVGACNCRGPDGPCSDCESRSQARDEWFDEPSISPREAEAYARAAVAADRRMGGRG